MNRELIEDLTNLLSSLINFTLDKLPENLNVSSLKQKEVREVLAINITKEFYKEFTTENNNE